MGVEPAAVESAVLRVSDAHARFTGSPLSQVAGRLEREAVVTSVFGTNSNEDGTLFEEETRLALDPDPSQVQDSEPRRVFKIEAAHALASHAVAAPDWRLDLPFVRDVHAAS